MFYLIKIVMIVCHCTTLCNLFISFFLFHSRRCLKFKLYLEKLYSRRERWALCYRSMLPVRGNNTNNYCEAAMRILKDKILLRTKAYNVPQLFDFLATRLSNYYESKMTQAAVGHWENFQKSRFLLKPSNIKPDDVYMVSRFLQHHC